VVFKFEKLPETLFSVSFSGTKIDVWRIDDSPTPHYVKSYDIT